MDDIALKGRKMLRQIEAGHRRLEAEHRRQGRRIAEFHDFLAAVVKDLGCGAGMTEEVVANITGPKVPPKDD